MASVASQGFWDGFNWMWSFSWNRQLRPQDQIEKACLDEMLQQVFPALKTRDKFIWSHSKSGNFSTRSFTLELDKLRPPSHHDAVKGVWKGLVPHRIEVFVWIALMGKINKRSKLARIGIIPPDCDKCPLCDSESESCDHLMLHCSISYQLWNWWMDLWDIKWVFPCTLRDAFDQWCCAKKPPFFKKVWTAIFFIMVWTIWKERNLRIFGSSSSSLKNLKELILLRLGWWISSWPDDFPYSPTDISRNPECLLWNGREKNALSHASNQIPISWCPPDIDCIKWNVDASVNPLDSRSAIGGVLRNFKGIFLCLFSSPIPSMEINSAEILAIHRVIKITLSSNIYKSSKIILEFDSSNAVLWSNSDAGGPWNLSFHLNFIRNARSKNLNIKIIHRGRNANFVADSLAKQGLHRQSEFIAWL